MVWGLLAAGCAWERPVHPLRLEGFPGAPVEEGCFDLVAGRTWTFRDRLDASGKPLVLRLERREKGFVLTGRSEGELGVRWEGGRLEILRDGRVVDAPLRVPGRAGDRWKAAGAACTIFGYDRLEVLGEERRALVVAVERGAIRDLYWFVRGMGWVRIRTERRGNPVRDALLVAFEAGPPN